MFDRSAIEKIEELTSSKGAPSTDIPTMVIPCGNEIISLEPFLLKPLHHKLRFATTHISEFIEFSKKNKTSSSVTYIDTDNSTAISIFDQGDTEQPGWGHHQANLNLKKTPAYAALLNNNTAKQNQQAMVDFVTDWQNNIQFTNDKGEKIPFMEAVNRIRRVSITKNASVDNETGDFKSHRSAMESIEIKSGQNELPAAFLFITEPHNDFSRYEFSCQIRAHTTENQVGISYRIIGLESEKLDIGNEFREKIIESMPDSAIYLGTINHR